MIEEKARHPVSVDSEKFRELSPTSERASPDQVTAHDIDITVIDRLKEPLEKESVDFND